MRRQFKWDKKYLHWGITAFCVIACSILFYMALNYLPLLVNAMKTMGKILGPFIWGLVISYLLGPLTKKLDSRVFSPVCRRLYRKNKNNDGSRLARGLAVTVSILVLLIVLTALVYLIIPQLYSSLETIVSNSSMYIANATEFTERFLKDYPEVEDYATAMLGNVNETVVSWIKAKALPELGSLVTNVTAGVYYVLMGIYNLVIGIIVSMYILGNAETFGANAKRFIYSIFPLEDAHKIRSAIAFIDKTFIGFINGKLLDSAIIGLICYVVCALLKMPYALLVSVIVGVTNVIPFFGPFIGAIPSALIILLVDPFKCLIFVVFVIILQQVDGNFIGPKILGSTTGITGFWVMFSIIVGAGLFGFWGMLLGVPVFVVIYTAVNHGIDERLKESDLPWETADYLDLDYFDPITHEAVKKPSEEE